MNANLTETIQRAKGSISILQSAIINVLEKGSLTPVKIHDFMLGYNDINEISGRIRGEDDSAVALFVFFIEDYLQRYVSGEGINLEGEEFLNFVIKKWNNFKIYLFFMRNIFAKISMFMKKNTLESVAFVSFKKAVFENISEKLNRTIFEFLEKERDDIPVPKEKLKTIISVG